MQPAAAKSYCINLDSKGKNINICLKVSNGHIGVTGFFLTVAQRLFVALLPANWSTNWHCNTWKLQKIKNYYGLHDFSVYI